MNHDDFFRELARSPSYSSLSASDLEGMAKRASNMYLSYDTPLNEAVVKVAQECHGISPEQVKRIVEMSNTTTYQRLFEKGASDRNVQFDIADPSEVLRRLNTGASAPIVKVASPDYSSPPPIPSTKSIEADMALCSLFNVELPPTRSMEKSAMIDLARGQAALEIFNEKEQVLKAQKKTIEMQMRPPEVATAPSIDELNQNMRPQMAKSASDPSDEAYSRPAIGSFGVPQPMIDEAHKRVVNTALSKGLQGAVSGGVGGALAGGLYNAIRGGSGVLNRLGRGAVGALSAAPVGATLGGVFGLVGGVQDAQAAHKRELAELIARRAIMNRMYTAQEKSAMAYLKSSMPDADLVGKDLQAKYSFDSIKSAARSNESQYAEANPYRDLVRVRTSLDKQAEDVNAAISENEYHLKTAQSDLSKQVTQHVLSGGNLGEVVHLLSSLGSNEQVKTAMKDIASDLERRLPERQFTNLQVGLIEYEMSKSASSRIVNPENPICQAFSGIIKLSSAQDLLLQAKQEIDSLLNEANQLVSKVSNSRD